MTAKFTKKMIAPCGMNCAVCRAHLREKNRCPGCNNNPTIGYCKKCIIRNCNRRKASFCFSCETFPCLRLRQLDKRYRTKYAMSEIENLQIIRDRGIDYFISDEFEKWQSDNGVLCVHDKKYYKL